MRVQVHAPPVVHPRGDIDDARRRTQGRQQQPGEQERAQVVGGERQLVAVHRAAAPGTDDPGVVDQPVDTTSARADLAGRGAHAGHAFTASIGLLT